MSTQMRTPLSGIKPLARINYDDHNSAQQCGTQYNPLTRFCKQNELSKLTEDSCYIDRRDYDSKRPFKWQTYNHHPFGCKLESTCYPGQFYWDGYGISGCNVDQESKVNRYPGYKATNLNVHQELPTLPVNLPRVRGYFSANIESSLRAEPTFNNKQCTNTSEKAFIPYTFQDFTALCFNPQETKFIIPEDSFNRCFPNAKYFIFGGEDSRHDRMGPYRNSCNNKIQPSINLSYSNFGY